MNLSSLKAMYTPIDKARFDAMLLPKAKVKAKRFIHEKTIKFIVSLIKANKRITRIALVTRSGLSKSAVDYAIQTLFDQELIVKKRDTKLIGYPVTYSMSK
jgi:predicted transcriptional regulator